MISLITFKKIHNDKKLSNELKQRNQFSLQTAKKYKYNVSFSVKSHRSNLFQVKIVRAKNIKDSKLVKLQNSLRQSNSAQKSVKSKCVNQLSSIRTTE